MTLMNCPAADGLFHRITLSGHVCGRVRAPEGMTEKQIAAEAAARILEELAIDPSEPGRLETLPYWFLADAAFKVKEELEEKYHCGYRFEPIADGIHVMHYDDTHFFREGDTGREILIGGDFGDSCSNFRKPLLDNQIFEWEEETVKTLMQQLYGDRAEAIAAEFAKAYPEKKPVHALFVDRKSRHTLINLANAYAKAGGKVYACIFCLDLPSDNGTVPYHCCDTAYITHNARFMEANYIPGISDSLQDQICGAYCAFAAKGDPSTELLREWEPVSDGAFVTMLFDREVRKAVNHDRALQTMLEPWYEG